MNASESYLRKVLLKFISGTMGFILSTASGIIVARALGAEGNGTASLLVLIPSTVTWFINLGIGRANGYLLGTKKHTLQTLMGNSVSLAALISLLVGVIGWMTMPLYLPLLSESNINWSMLCLAFLVVPPSLLESYLAGLLLGLERIAQLCLVTIARFSASLVLNVLLVLVLGLGVWGVPLSAIAIPCICVAIYFYFLREDAKMGVDFDLRAFKDALVFGIQGHVGNILHFLNLRFDMFIIAFIVGTESVGIYAVATALAELLPQSSTAFSFVLFSRTASSDPETANRFTPRVVRLSIFVTAMAAMGMLLMSRSLIAFFYSEEYLPALRPLRILLPGMVSLGYAGVIYSDLGGRGKPYYSTYGALASLLVTVGLDCLLIPRWDIIGAALASSAAYTTNAVMAACFYLRETRTKAADLLLIRKGDIRTGLNAGREMALSLNQAFRAWWLPRA